MEDITQLKHYSWDEFNEIDVKDWGKICQTAFQACKDACLQFGHAPYNLLHNIIIHKHWLYDKKFFKSPNRETCNRDDSLLHFHTLPVSA